VNVVVVVRHGDGKLYPENWQAMPPEVIRHLQALAHHLRCVEHLSYRAAERALSDRYGERRSLGQVWYDVHESRCRHCEPQPPKPPVKPRSFAWR
jgi:hypothetical protein